MLLMENNFEQAVEQEVEKVKSMFIEEKQQLTVDKEDVCS